METKDQPWNPLRGFLNPLVVFLLELEKPFTDTLNLTPCLVLNPSLSRRHLERQQRHIAGDFLFYWNLEILKSITRVNQLKEQGGGSCC
ncbi:hypothetical protein P8452_55467 [Trifolium repens]|nr:hypothetical protein P8452_55467 [Trifolium repens]